jgi:hypothetical protein
VVEHKFLKKCKVVEQKKARWSSKTMQDGGAEVKQKMQDGRAKKCKAVEQKLKMDEQKNVRWTSKEIWRSRTPSWVGSGWGRRYDKLGSWVGWAVWAGFLLTLDAEAGRFPRNKLRPILGAGFRSSAG